MMRKEALGSVGSTAGSSWPSSAEPSPSPASTPTSADAPDVDADGEPPYTLGATEHTPYQCPFCDKAFPRHFYLKKHEQSSFAVQPRFISKLIPKTEPVYGAGAYGDTHLGLAPSPRGLAEATGSPLRGCLGLCVADPAALRLHVATDPAEIGEIETSLCTMSNRLRANRNRDDPPPGRRNFAVKSSAPDKS
ncbi:unnamed protein product, partial [Iphiclides podalirius]